MSEASPPVGVRQHEEDRAAVLDAVREHGPCTLADLRRFFVPCFLAGAAITYALPLRWILPWEFTLVGLVTGLLISQIAQLASRSSRAGLIYRARFARQVAWRAFRGRPIGSVRLCKGSGGMKDYWMVTYGVDISGLPHPPTGVLTVPDERHAARLTEAP